MGTLASKNPELLNKVRKPKWSDAQLAQKKAIRDEEKNQKDIVLFGNDYKKQKDKGKGTHQWSLFVRGYDGRKGNKRDDFGIEKVEFELHPDYKPNLITLTTAPFEITRDGWGVFDAKARIYTKGTETEPGEMREVTRQLDFVANGSHRKYNLKGPANQPDPRPPRAGPSQAAGAAAPEATPPGIDSTAGNLAPLEEAMEDRFALMQI